MKLLRSMCVCVNVFVYVCVHMYIHVIFHEHNYVPRVVWMSIHTMYKKKKSKMTRSHSQKREVLRMIQ